MVSRHLVNGVGSARYTLEVRLVLVLGTQVGQITRHGEKSDLRGGMGPCHHGQIRRQLVRRCPPCDVKVRHVQKADALAGGPGFGSSERIQVEVEGRVAGVLVPTD